MRAYKWLYDIGTQRPCLLEGAVANGLRRWVTELRVPGSSPLSGDISFFLDGSFFPILFLNFFLVQYEYIWFQIVDDNL